MMPESLPLPLDAGKLQLRPAYFSDAAILLQWRNDPVTRQASRSQAEVSPDGHQLWLERLLKNTEQRLWIAQIDGVPIGTVRADRSQWGEANAGDCFEVSWTLAPVARGQRLAGVMVQQLILRLESWVRREGRVRAEIRPENIASIQVALRAGMQQVGQVDDVLVFERRISKPSG